MDLLSFGKKSIEQIMKDGVKNEAQLKQLISEACQRGAMHAKLFVDAHGPDKKATEDVLIDLINQVTKEKGVLYCKGEIESSIEANELYTAFSEIEVVTANFNTLVNLALRYAPAGVEILEPDNLSLSMKECQDILLDASQSSQMYSKFILENSMNEAQKVDFAERIKRKAEYGAKLRGSKQITEDGTKSQ